MADVNIFDIRRASLVDGPGIRTVVFFKGCGLRCAWCHNPESWSPRAQLAYFKSRCAGCLRCVSACPARAIGGDLRADASRCIACGRCERACPASARKLYGKRVSAESIMRTALADAPFYSASNGGVTFSGGECTEQPDALIELLASCRSEGVSGAIDTAGNAPFDVFERALPLADIVLYDVKFVTPALSERFTGVDGARAIANLRAIYDISPEKLILRVPVVPGANDTPAEMQLIAAFLSGFKRARVELLPYHKLCEAKAEALGVNAYSDEAPTRAHMDALRSIFIESGVNAI